MTERCLASQAGFGRLSEAAGQRRSPAALGGPQRGMPGRDQPGPPLRALPLLLLLLPRPPGEWRGARAAGASPASPAGRSRAGLAEPERRAFSCLASAPSLAWYLRGERQDSDGARRLVAAAEDGGGSFEVTARRLDRQLNCSATDPATGQVSSASVALNVQFEPELVRLDAQVAEPGLLLVLLVLVRASPPASITWVDQDGRLLVNTSRFLIVDAQTFPWLADHTLQLQLRSLAGNVSFRAANSSVPLPGFLDTRIELPLLALVVGGTAALGTLLALSALISCLVYRKGKAAAGFPLPVQLPRSISNNLKPMGARLPRANRSLPANLQLNDLTPKAKAKVQEDGAAAQQEGEALSEPEDSLALAHKGLGRFPMVGYIYRASSMSSDEIWL
ncbi:transmembrane protein 25 [Tiliqua scincoides]|uniref:transmembrane protein 25 n=1 Tax=Tiliqua scincoides TaxID=71010 RepID=UPI0034623110